MYLFCTSYKFHCLYLRTNKRSVHSKVLKQTNSTLLKMLIYQLEFEYKSLSLVVCLLWVFFWGGGKKI